MADELDVNEGTLVGRAVGSPDVDDLVASDVLTILFPASTDLSMGSNNLTDLADPASAQDAATQAYVDSGDLVTFNTQTGSYTLVLTDRGKIIKMNVAGSNNLTVPPNSSVALAAGCTIGILQYGAGATTVVAGSGVTIRSRGADLILAGQYAMATLIQTDTLDEWILTGDL